MQEYRITQYGVVHPHGAITVHADGKRGCDSKANGLGCRPVVVLDPEDTEGRSLLPVWLRSHAADIERECTGPVVNDLRLLADRIEAAYGGPKPEEPKGMGAVVRDADGVLYVGLGDFYGGGQLRWKGGRGMTFTSYDRINVVEVLSEGVAER